MPARRPLGRPAGRRGRPASPWSLIKTKRIRNYQELISAAFGPQKTAINFGTDSAAPVLSNSFRPLCGWTYDGNMAVGAWNTATGIRFMAVCRSDYAAERYGMGWKGTILAHDKDPHDNLEGSASTSLRAALLAIEASKPLIAMTAGHSVYEDAYSHSACRWQDDSAFQRTTEHNRKLWDRHAACFENPHPFTSLNDDSDDICGVGPTGRGLLGWVPDRDDSGARQPRDKSCVYGVLYAPDGYMLEPMIDPLILGRVMREHRINRTLCDLLNLEKPEMYVENINTDRASDSVNRPSYASVARQYGCSCRYPFRIIPTEQLIGSLLGEVYATARPSRKPTVALSNRLLRSYMKASGRGAYYHNDGWIILSLQKNRRIAVSSVDGDLGRRSLTSSIGGLDSLGCGRDIRAALPDVLERALADIAVIDNPDRDLSVSEGLVIIDRECPGLHDALRLFQLDLGLRE